MEPSHDADVTESQAADANMEAFFEHRKSDVKSELKNIQNCERPVTGQNRRDTLKHFMERHVPPADETTQTGNRSPNIDRKNEQRKVHNVPSRIDGKNEQRKVSSNTDGMKEKENVRPYVVTDSADEYHCGNVSRELQRMLQDRPVSSRLQSKAYRKQLEDIVQGSSGGVGRRQPPYQGRPPTRNSVVTTRVTQGRVSTQCCTIC